MAANFDATTSEPLILGLWLRDPSPPINHGRLSEDALQTPISHDERVEEKTTNARTALARFDKMFKPTLPGLS